MDIVYCLCGKPYDPTVLMIQCDACKDWFHAGCCNVQEYAVIDIEKYYCPRCVIPFGPSILKPRLNYHRYDYWEPNAEQKSVQTGTPVFIRELLARHFTTDSDVVIHMRGQQLTEMVLQQQGFNCPIVVDTKDGLGMNLPPDNFSFYDVEAFIGGNTEVDVIDVTRQSDIKMTLSDFVAYYNSLDRTRIFNIVSLEFSNTGLSRLVDAPAVARKLDWVYTMWPPDYRLPPPQVQKYCLMSVKDSYTDFHVDFGGTSVWYHVLRGQKVFYFIKPTPANLTLYQQWMTSSNQSETFFGDQVDCCYKYVLMEGQTMFIPTGWVHAVFTPVDSLVFGGNFLHSLNIPMQLQIYDLERKTRTIEKFRYPYFQTINWFAAVKLCQQIKDLNSNEKKCPTTIISSLKTLLSFLKHWNMEKDYNTAIREQMPDGLNTTKLIKDISKEIRQAERFINALNPPKPERESKRKRRKPYNKDFIDFSLTSKFPDDLFPSAKSEYNQVAPLKLTLPKPAMYPYTSVAKISKLVTAIPDSTTDLPSSCRPEETTAIHRGGAVLKFRLGTKDIFAHSQSDESGSVNHLMTPPNPNSVYDFHDDSANEEETLTIDESQKKRKKVTKSKNSHSRKSKTSWCIKNKKSKRDVNANAEIPKNGIESLLQASALTTTTNSKYMEPSSSTEEAIAGMLSISQMYVPDPQRNKKKSCSSSSSPIDEENVSNVHQDEDYIYPSLDNSDDEDVHIFKPRGRSKVDEAWNPKARLGPLLPKMNRPTREGTKKQAVEKVLEAAAARRATVPAERSPKRQYRRKKVKIEKPDKAETIVSSTSTSNPMPSTSAGVTSTIHKQRKGMKTVKQRLGKILKIHKMIY